MMKELGIILLLGLGLGVGEVVSDLLIGGLTPLSLDDIRTDAEILKIVSDAVSEINNKKNQELGLGADTRTRELDTIISASVQFEAWDITAWSRPYLVDPAERVKYTLDCRTA